MFATVCESMRPNKRPRVTEKELHDEDLDTDPRRKRSGSNSDTVFSVDQADLSSGGSVVGLGGLAGAIGGMLMAKFAGIILEPVGSFQPIFIVASCAYLLALLVLHLIVPRYAPVTLSQEAA